MLKDEYETIMDKNIIVFVLLIFYKSVMYEFLKLR